MAKGPRELPWGRRKSHGVKKRVQVTSFDTSSETKRLKGERGLCLSKKAEQGADFFGVAHYFAQGFSQLIDVRLVAKIVPPFDRFFKESR